MFLDNNFSINQKKAIDHFNGPMIVVAGPGSGKTTVIGNRVVELINKGVKEDEILVITFTKNSADDMKNRFFSIANIDETKVNFSTFHKLFFLVLRSFSKYKNINILNDNFKLELIKKIFQENSFFCDEESLADFQSEVTLLKSKCSRDTEDIKYYFSKDFFSAVYIKYEEFKKENNYIDFDDMIYLAYYELLENEKLLKFWQEKYSYVLIDEFQDINEIQYKGIKLLYNKNNFFIVGDDDQSIYSFRGASPKFFMDFKQDFPNACEIHLDVNYRSTEQIISLTNAIIIDNNKRLDKNIVGTSRSGKNPVILTSLSTFDENRFIAKKIDTLVQNGVEVTEIAVLYRTNMQGQGIVDALMDYNLPFVIKDGFRSIYNHFIFKDFIAYYNAASNIDYNKNIFRIINKPNRYLGKALLEDMDKLEGNILNNILYKSNLPEWRLESTKELMYHLKNISNKKPCDAFKYFCNVINYEEYLLEVASQRKTRASEYFKVLQELKDDMERFESFAEYFDHIEKLEMEILKNKDNLEGIILSTLHSTKGLEFDTVFIAGVNEGIIPYDKGIKEGNIEEERRLFYVGLTRAKNNLFISMISNKNDKSIEMSTFIKKLIKRK
ncbi:MAG: ATP-dependent helicase [Lachnospirales bacterium]